VGARGGKK
jgi:DNA-directed RNA polymerase subunit E'/Rpb7